MFSEKCTTFIRIVTNFCLLSESEPESSAEPHPVDTTKQPMVSSSTVHMQTTTMIKPTTEAPKTTPSKKPEVNIAGETQQQKIEAQATTTPSRGHRPMSFESAIALMACLLVALFFLMDSYTDFATVCGCFAVIFTIPSAMMYLIRNHPDSIPFGAKLNAPFEAQEQKHQQQQQQRKEQKAS